MKKRWGVFVLLALALLLCTVVAGAEGSIIGTWNGSGTATVSGMSLKASVSAEFELDGDFDMDISVPDFGMKKGMEGTYRYAGDQLTLTVDGYGVFTFQAPITGDNATLSGRIELAGYSADLSFKLKRWVPPTPVDDPVIVVTEKEGALIHIRDDLYEAVKGAALPALSYKAPTGWESASARWRSDKASVLAVRNNGAITAKKAGLAEVELKLLLGREDESADIDIRVVDLQLKNKKATLYLRERGKKRSTIALAPVAKPATASAAVTSCRYTSDNASVAAVDALGVVTAVAQGKARITATNEYGQTAVCRITVKK